MVTIVRNRRGPSVHRDNIAKGTRRRRCATIQEEIDELANGDDLANDDDFSVDLADENDGTPTSNVAANTVQPGRHIHPCICDLSEEAKQRIAAHQAKRQQFLSKYDRRVNEIEDLERKLEQMRLDAEREAAIEKELYGDEYEMVGRKMKRKKRSARRASMISLGVKTLIKWKKEPLIPVKYTRAWKLRRDNAAYCGRKQYYLPLIVDMDYKKDPKIPVRETQSYILRSNKNAARKYRAEIDAYDPHPYFITAYRTPF